MKAAGIVILFPLMSVVIVSLCVHGGAPRIAGLALLVASVVGFFATLMSKRARQQNSSKVLERTSR